MASRSRLRRPSVTTMLAAAVLVLLPVLATLQYRWVGQVGAHERERLRRTVANAAQAVSRDLDGEVVGALNRLDLDHLVDGSPSVGDVTAGDAAPPLIQDLFYAARPDGRRDDPPLSRCAWRAAVCTPVAWPAALDSLRRDLARAFRSDREDLDEVSRVIRRDRTSQPVIVVPIYRHRGDRRREGRHDDRLAGAALVLLNSSVLRDQVVPAIVHRHFGPASRSDFLVAIVDRERPLDVVYADEAAPLDRLMKNPEAWQELFTLRVDALEDHDVEDEGGAVWENRPAHIFDRDRDDDEEWMLVARNRQGSLQAAVDNLRWRNLLVSSGILALMGIAVGLIAVTARRAQSLARQQVEFVAGVSHELRTPVAAIHLAAQNLADGTVTDSPRARRYGATIQGESQRLREMIEQVLQFASLGGRQAERTRSAVAIGAVVEEVAGSARRHFPQADVVVDSPSDLPAVTGDAADLRVCLQNLVTNGIKYGGTPPRVHVAVAVERGRRGSEIQIAVDDNGPGVDAADRADIFEPFHRGRLARDHRIQGSGLGLYIARRIAEAHGGRIAVRSHPGRGSTFVLHLPVRQEAGAPQPVMPRGAPGSSS